ncbi:AbfB domain-containing protein, partial [Chryseobacterium sp. c4a]|uniref:AbfB domain-containing protein n=1 Tax=Chryseobacterium sp. c4a TaxID=1573582 RepID=UPI0016269747
DATFTVRKGFSNKSCYSFESVNNPGKYLYAPSGDKGQQIGVGTIDGANRRTEATFCAFKNVGSKDGIILKNSMPNNPEKYIRNVDGKVWADPALKSISNQNTFAQDMVWKVIDPLWNVEPVTNLELDKRISFQVTSSGFMDRVLRHSKSKGRTDVINSKSNVIDRKDATFTVRKGFSNKSCYSFESVNNPGKYLYAPSGDKGQQIGVGTIDGANRRTEATFCAFKNVGSKDGIILKNSMPNNPEKYIR